jgi:Na+/H+ antiporter NhaD/arsenite permease-like protein
MLYFYLCFGKKLKTGSKPVITESLDPKYAIADTPRFIASIIEFLIVVVLLITHAQTGLTVASIGVIAAVLTFIIFVRNNMTILKKVDWNTVLFFIGLFVVVGGLEETGVLDTLAGFIGKVSGGNAMVMVTVILWISAIASAVVDNIPFAATMVPVIRMLSATHGHIQLDTLAWALSLGTDIGGNATPIGASANVVGTSIADKNGHHISWGTYCKYAVPATVIVLVICTVYLFVRYL